jgi:hypothetical protein
MPPGLKPIAASRIFAIRLLKNYLQNEIQSLMENQRDSKSPFEKGGFRGISGA